MVVQAVVPSQEVPQVQVRVLNPQAYAQLDHILTLIFACLAVDDSTDVPNALLMEEDA